MIKSELRDINLQFLEIKSELQDINNSDICIYLYMFIIDINSYKYIVYSKYIKTHKDINCEYYDIYIKAELRDIN